MDNKQIKILLIEDSDEHAKLVEKKLEKFEELKIVWADTLMSGIEYLSSETPDIVLLDLILPDSSGIDTFTSVYNKVPSIPIVILSSIDDVKIAATAVQKGAQDFLVKGKLDKQLLKRAIYYAIERKRIVEELRQAHRKLKEATMQLIQSEKLSALGELIAGVAHELNNPLNGIKIICQSITRDIKKDRLETDELEPDLLDIINHVNKMAEIIDHMRVYTRRTEGPPTDKVDVNEVLENTFRFIGQQLTNHNIEVVKEIASDIPQVIGDPVRLEQVFMNLIINARNALESCEKDNKKIEIKTSKINNQQLTNGTHVVVVEVTDNGEGIPEELSEKIFQPFFTTKEPGKGTGLGLSISSKIVEEHNGRMEIESQIGEGTTFKVILPTAD